MVVVHGEGSTKCTAEFQRLRHILRHETDGAEKVIRHLRYLRDQHPRPKKLAAALKYFLAVHQDIQDNAYATATRA
jgi:hypothetical protein